MAHSNDNAGHEVNEINEDARRAHEARHEGHAAAKTEIAMLEEEKKKQVAIVPETGDLWVKAGDVVLAIKVVPPFGPAAVVSAKEPHPLDVSSRGVGRNSIDSISVIP